MHIFQSLIKRVYMGDDVFYLLVMNDAYKAEIKLGSYLKNDTRRQLGTH